MSSLAAMKAATRSKALEDQTHSERQRDLLVLILSHLRSHGYVDAATALLRESRAGDALARLDPADNMDLPQVLRECEEYHQLKFGRRPVFSRRAPAPHPRQSGTDAGEDAAAGRHARGKRGSNGRQCARHGATNATNETILPPLSTNHAAPNSNAGTKSLRSKKRTHQGNDIDNAVGQGIMGVSLTSPTTKSDDTQSQEAEPRPWPKPLPNFDGDAELRALALSIRRDIVQDGPRVPWSDIVGLDDAKRLLKEAIVLPRKYPQLFTGLRSPWRSALLYGVPGTGKTLLAKAVATESNTTFFNISASSIVSKFRGDSEKLIRMLFDLGRHFAPSTIFIDEVDSIMCHRGSGPSANEGSEHEGSRRMKTELLVQMDGLLANNSDMFIMAASNLPWDLDPAFLRRMEKRISIPLPNHGCRREMIRSHLSEFSPSFRKGELLEKAASLTRGFSGSDIKALCKEVAMMPLRRVLAATEVMDGPSDHENVSLLMKRNPITSDDFDKAIATTFSSTSAELSAQHEKWEKSH